MTCTIAFTRHRHQADDRQGEPRTRWPPPTPTITSSHEPRACSLSTHWGAGFGGSEACDEDRGLPAGKWSQSGACGSGWASIAPVMMMSLGWRRVDGPVAPSAGEDLFEEVPDLGLERGDLLVVDDGAAVEREDKVVAGRDRLFEEVSSAAGAGSSLSVAARACSRTRWKERNVKAARSAGASGSGGRGFRSRRPPRRRSLPSALFAVASDRDRGGGEDAFAIGRGVTSRSLRGAAHVCRCFRHRGSDRARWRPEARFGRLSVISG